MGYLGAVLASCQARPQRDRLGGHIDPDDPESQTTATGASCIICIYLYTRPSGAHQRSSHRLHTEVSRCLLDRAVPLVSRLR